MRKVIFVAVLGVALLSAWFVHSKVQQSRRETAYHTAIAPFRRDIAIGMTREEIKKYLDSRNLSYQQVYWGSKPSDAWSYAVKIGEEPSSIVCERWNVYVALDFTSAGRVPRLAPEEPLPSDVLAEMYVKKVGTCL
jgi:hypothetical protein